MAQQFALHDDTPAYNPRYADAFVVFAVTVLSLAVGCLVPGAARHGPVGRQRGGPCRLHVLLSVHLLVRRSLIAADGAGWRARARRRVDARAARDTGRRGCRARQRTRHAPRRMRRDRTLGRSRSRRARDGRLGCARTCAHADPFSFRPQAGAGAAGGARSLTPDGRRQMGARRDESRTRREPQVNVEQVLKKLADALNATPTVAPRVEKPAAASETEVMIGQSVAALQAAARSMSRPPASFEPASERARRAACRRGGRRPSPLLPAIPGRASRRHAARAQPPARAALPRPSWRSAWRCCSSRSTPWPRGGRAISR